MKTWLGLNWSKYSVGKRLGFHQVRKSTVSHSMYELPNIQNDWFPFAQPCKRYHKNKRHKEKDNEPSLFNVSEMKAGIS